jgi:hypothetical protein
MPPAAHFGIIVSEKSERSLYKKRHRTNLEVVNKATFLKDKPSVYCSFFIKDLNDLVARV